MTQNQAATRATSLYVGGVIRSTHIQLLLPMRWETRLLRLEAGPRLGPAWSTQRNVISESGHVPLLCVQCCPVRKSIGKDRGCSATSAANRGPCKMNRSWSNQVRWSSRYLIVLLLTLGFAYPTCISSLYIYRSICWQKWSEVGTDVEVEFPTWPKRETPVTCSWLPVHQFITLHSPWMQRAEYYYCWMRITYIRSSTSNRDGLDTSHSSGMHVYSTQHVGTRQYSLHTEYIRTCTELLAGFESHT